MKQIPKLLFLCPGGEFLVWHPGGFAVVPLRTRYLDKVQPNTGVVTLLGAHGLFSSPGSDLQAPLESLELPFCSLLPGDVAFLCQSPHAPALRKLDLSGHDLTENLLGPLGCLLEESSASLCHLDLVECRLTDTRLEVLLPALCCCSHLQCLGLFGNPLSTPGLKTLLRKTLVLPDLRLVVYPYPVDCYNHEPPQPLPGSGWVFEDTVDEERLATVNAELCQILASSGRADAVWTTNLCHLGALDYFAL